MITTLEANERKTADKRFADSHPDRGGSLVRINRNTLIAVPHGRNKAEYLAQWHKQYQRYISRD